MQQRHRKQVILAMGNFGFFANVCKKFNLITELHEMFKLTAEIAHKYCSGFVIWVLIIIIIMINNGTFYINVIFFQANRNRN